MKVRFPLYLKLAAWFALNLALIGFLLAAFAGFRLPYAFEFLLTGKTGARLQRMADLIASDLRSADRTNWTAILEKHSSAQGVQYYLFRGPDDQLAGPPLALPAEVKEQFGGPRLRGGRGLRPANARPANPPEAEEEEMRPAGPAVAAGRLGRNMAPRPAFVLRTSDPTRYWVGLHAGLRVPEGRPAPAILLAVSDTIDGNGLFFDWRPVAGFGGVALALSVLLWFPLAQGITRSLKQMTAVTAEIARGRFEAKAPVHRSDELGQLAEAINAMGSRIEWSVKGQKRFLGDIAHELCSPIARVQMALGILEQRADDRQKEYVADVREELDHMSRLVNELLAFSKASLGSQAARQERLELEPLLRTVAQREGGKVAFQIAPGVTVRGDGELIQRAVGNVLRNALRYAGADGLIQIEADAEGEQVRIAISDAGPGIPEEHLARVFEPFYRVDPSRSADTGGIGLGLTIVKTCVEACGGSVKCQNRKPQGLRVEIRLPNGTRQSGGKN